MEKWRLIIDKKCNGFENMAIDEALLLSVLKKETIPVLRFYQWQEPFLSIGRFQKHDFFSSKKLPFVRRLTGGKAVIHQYELTYSMMVPLPHKYFNKTIQESYNVISSVICESLNSIGINAKLENRDKSKVSSQDDSCFNVTTKSEITLDGLKLVGSAQRRFKEGFIQHGSIIFNYDYDLYESYFGKDSLDNLAEIRDFNEGMLPQLIENIKKIFNSSYDIDFENSKLSDNEITSKCLLLNEKYLSREWNFAGTLNNFLLKY